MLISVESPYAGTTDIEVRHHTEYAQACCRFVLEQGHSPFASHLLYTQPGILNDRILRERNLGIMAGKAWEKHADETWAFLDFGLSAGMDVGIKMAEYHKRKVRRWKLYPEPNEIL